MATLYLRLLWLEEVRREEVRRARDRRRRLRLRDRYELLADKRDFQSRYRITPQLLEELCRELGPLLPRPRRSDSISLAKKKFGMPGVVGCVDCTHVALKKPRDEELEDRCWNSKYYHSRNVQIICDAHSRIISVDASFGGAALDSWVFHQSLVKRHLEQLREDTWLLGDSGYPLRKYLMTPISNTAEDTPESHYNKIQRNARSSMERTLEALKGRWRCLLAKHELNYDPKTVARMVYACCVLHNFCKAHALPAPQLSEEDRRVERFLQERRNLVAQIRSTAAAELRAGQQVRDNLVRTMSALS